MCQMNPTKIFIQKHFDIFEKVIYVNVKLYKFFISYTCWSARIFTFAVTCISFYKLLFLHSVHVPMMFRQQAC